MQYTAGDQSKLQGKLKKKAIISDDIGSLKRGWYICGTGQDSIWYLHCDGIIRHGVSATSRAFWSDEETALAFYRKWRKEI